MIDTKALRRKLSSDDPIDHIDIHANVKSVLAELLDRIEEAEKENAKLRIALAEKVTSEATLRDLNFGNGFIKATFEGGAVQLMVDALADQFVGSGAPNYIEMQFHSNATGPLLFTLQRVDGKTPHQLRAEAEQECDALRADKATLQQMAYSLKDRLEVAEKECDALRAEVQTWQEQAKAYWSKITEMEKQEPVGTLHDDGYFVWRKTAPREASYGGWKMKLYALPGAQPAPSFADAYQGAMEEAAIWKKRALEAEDLNRKFVAEINGPTYMGESAQPAPSIPEAVMEVIAGLIYEVERNICQHEETHRGGQWEICDMCGARWADDMGGKPEFKWPEVVEKARDMLEAAPGAKGDEK